MFAFAAPTFIDSLLLKLFSEQTVNYVIWPFIQVGLVIVITTGWVAYATYLERKISAFMQARLGPMRVGPWGLLQPIADGIKLLTKEDFIPENADRWIFFVAPYIAVVAAFIVMAVVPFGPDWAVITDVNIGVLFVLAVSSVGVLALILAGWSSNSKYALMGALRSSAQMVSYEVSMGMAIIGALMFARTLSLSGVVNAQASNSIWFILYQPIGFMIFLISGIAENNRAPFDLPEAESELVAGFHTEYSGFRWSLFFMAEYAAMVVVTAVATTLYLGGWYFPVRLSVDGGEGFSQRFCRRQRDRISREGGPAPLFILLAALDVAAFSLRSVDGSGLEMDVAGGADQYCDDGDWRDCDSGTRQSGWNAHDQIADNGLALTRSGQAIAIAIGIVNLFITAGLLSLINWRSRDFNLKKQRRQIRLVDSPKEADVCR